MAEFFAVARREVTVIRGMLTFVSLVIGGEALLLIRGHRRHGGQLRVRLFVLCAAVTGLCMLMPAESIKGTVVVTKNSRDGV